MLYGQTVHIPAAAAVRAFVSVSSITGNCFARVGAPVFQKSDWVCAFRMTTHWGAEFEPLQPPPRACHVTQLILPDTSSNSHCTQMHSTHLNPWFLSHMACDVASDVCQALPPPTSMTVPLTPLRSAGQIWIATS